MMLMFRARQVLVGQLLLADLYRTTGRCYPCFAIHKQNYVSLINTEFERKKQYQRRLLVTKSTSDSKATAQRDDDSTTSSSNRQLLFESSSLSLFRWSNLSGRIRRSTGNVMVTLGFGASSIASFYSNPNEFDQIVTSMSALQTFLKESKIDEEVLRPVSRRFLSQLVILARVQKVLRGQDPRDLVSSETRSQNCGVPIPSTTEAMRYSKYAVAVYGDSVIQAAQMDDMGSVDTRVFGELTSARLSEHIGVPIQNIAAINVAYSGDNNCLRHFVAVDHSHRTVVLAIRGTFSLAETFANGVAFSVPFCGGQAHSEMVKMAETVWGFCSATVLDLLSKNEGYEFVITGHSLGAGTAALLNIKCHENNRELVMGRVVRCFTYAAPPVFEPLEAATEAVNSCTNYIYGSDAVPFLSVDAVRHTMACLAVVGDNINKLGTSSRLKLSWGYSEPEQDLIDEVDSTSKKRLKTKPGAPVLCIPAAHNLWVKEIPGSEGTSYDAKDCDSKQLSTFGIQLDSKMLVDHFPQRYQHALHRLREGEGSQS